jgi:diaminopimelate epimerase
MTRIPFSKYHGAGNDFIMIDDRLGIWGGLMTEEWIERACHRRWGIGADGLILLQRAHDGTDFFMRYYNSDGRISTFCGNGGRCIVAFAASLGIHSGKCSFSGTDGQHEGEIMPDGLIQISMQDVDSITTYNDHTFILHTGSPHFVTFKDSVNNINVFQEGRSVRYHSDFAPDGINVNFVKSQSPYHIQIRTYERGVEDETYACGTGVVAAAIANAFLNDSYEGHCEIEAKGGTLRVEFERKDKNVFSHVQLLGPAVAVFNGETTI